MQVTLLTFGYKYQNTPDVDVLFDMRLLPNPYYIEHLQHKNGKHPEVSDYVLHNDIAAKYIPSLLTFLDNFLSLRDQSKDHVTIGIACTGGQHRSVAVAEYLKQQLKSNHIVEIIHRDMKEEGDE